MAKYFRVGLSCLVCLLGGVVWRTSYRGRAAEDEIRRGEEFISSPTLKRKHPFPSRFS